MKRSLLACSLAAIHFAHPMIQENQLKQKTEHLLQIATLLKANPEKQIAPAMQNKIDELLKSSTSDRMDMDALGIEALNTINKNRQEACEIFADLGLPFTDALKTVLRITCLDRFFFEKNSTNNQPRSQQGAVRATQVQSAPILSAQANPQKIATIPAATPQSSPSENNPMMSTTDLTVQLNNFYAEQEKLTQKKEDIKRGKIEATIDPATTQKIIEIEKELSEVESFLKISKEPAIKNLLSTQKQTLKEKIAQLRASGKLTKQSMLSDIDKRLSEIHSQTTPLVEKALNKNEERIAKLKEIEDGIAQLKKARAEINQKLNRSTAAKHAAAKVAVADILAQGDTKKNQTSNTDS